MNKFEELEAYVAVVDCLSFTVASEKLGVAKSQLSRRVSELEKRLGVQLMHRTTRKLSLTDTGHHFYQRAVGLLADLADAEEMVSYQQSALSGKIKLAAPLALGLGQLSKPIADFIHQHADVSIHIDLNDREIDLVEDGFDIAIRVGQMQDSSLIARKLANVHFAVCASPQYLRSHGEPRQPAELSNHEILYYSNIALGKQWTFLKDGQTILPRVKYRLSANNGDLLAKMASFGVGITVGPLFYLRGYIDSGELTPILQDYTSPEVGMYAVYPPGRLVNRRVKLLSDYLRDYFKDQSI